MSRRRNPTAPRATVTARDRQEYDERGGRDVRGRDRRDVRERRDRSCTHCGEFEQAAELPDHEGERDASPTPLRTHAGASRPGARPRADEEQHGGQVGRGRNRSSATPRPPCQSSRRRRRHPQPSDGHDERDADERDQQTCPTSQRVRETAVASTGSSRSAVSSARVRRAEDTAKPGRAIARSSRRSRRTRRRRPGRADRLRYSFKVGLSSTMFWIDSLKEPSSTPIDQTPTAQPSNAARCRRQFSPTTPDSDRLAVARPGRACTIPAPRSRRLSKNTVAATSRAVNPTESAKGHQRLSS